MRLRTEYAEFEVPAAEALAGGQWIWDVRAWRGIRSASLYTTGALFLGAPYGIFSIEGRRRAMRRVRRFCAEHGYREIADQRGEDIDGR